MTKEIIEKQKKEIKELKEEYSICMKTNEYLRKECLEMEKEVDLYKNAWENVNKKLQKIGEEIIQKINDFRNGGIDHYANLINEISKIINNSREDNAKDLSSIRPTKESGVIDSAMVGSNDICECGHSYERHDISLDLFSKPGLKCSICKCKQFKQKEKKGCGKLLFGCVDNKGKTIACGELNCYCPECKQKEKVE